MLPLPSQVGAMASSSATAAPELLAGWASAVGARAGTALLGGVSNLVDGTASSISAPPGDPCGPLLGHCALGMVMTK